MKALILLVALALLSTGAWGQTSISASGVIESTSGGFKFPDGSVQNTAALPDGTYILSDIGPAGGFVFHVTDDGLHGLEAAPSDQLSTAWGCFGTNIVGANATAIGKGLRNTEDILYGCETDTIAADVADAFLSPSGYFDWYLPSIGELDLMYENLHLEGLGDFVSDVYWSSTEASDNSAWNQSFDDGSQYNIVTKSATYRVRAVRAF